MRPSRITVLRRLLQIALPMVVSQASDTIMMFVDRLFLSRLGETYLSAAMSGGIMQFMVGSLFIGTVGLSFFSARGFRNTTRNNRKGVLFLLLSGAASAGGIICMFFALGMGKVVVVTPLQSTNPLFALLFSWLFLGRLEKITPKLIIGSILVVSGVILITFGSG